MNNRGHHHNRMAIALMMSTSLLIANAATAQGIEEITVTARKRAENLQQVPMAISAFSADQLEAAQVTNITDLERMTPNVTVSDTGGLTAGAVSVFMRGIGNDPGFDQGVGIYIDDIYLNRTTGALLETYDIERIEVLKGPQGHLYGRNTIGGAIKYVTRRPSEEVHVDIQAKTGRFDLKQLKANLSGPLVDGRLYGGVGFISKTQDGIQRNSVDGHRFWDSDFQGLRVNLLADLGESVSAYLTADYGKDNSSPRLANRVAVDAATLAGVDFVISGANRYLGSGMGLVSTPNDASIPTNIDVVSTEFTSAFKKFEIETRTTAFTIEWDISDRWRLKSVSAARVMDNTQVFDFDGSEQQFITSIIPRKSDDYSQEFQLNFSGDQVNAVAGLYYLDATQESLTNNPQYLRLRAVQTLDRRVLDNEEGLKSTSIYASLDWDFTEKWQLSLGGRYTQDKKTIYQVTRNNEGFFALARLRGFPPSAIVAVAPGQEALAETQPMFAGWVSNSRFLQTSSTTTVHGSETWSEFTPNVKLSWFVDENTMLYVGYSTGFKTGGFNNTATAVAKYDPETVDSYTFGFKTTLMDDLRLNGELFYNDYQDKQLATVAMQNGVLASTQSNVGKMKTKGAELEIVWAPLDSLLFGFNLGYLDTEVNSYETRDNLGNLIDIARYTAIGFSPELTAQARAQYEFTVGSMGRIMLNTDVSYRDESYTNSPIDLRDALSRVQVQEAHEIWNASATWFSPDEKWRVALDGRNLNDERVLTNTYKVAQFVTGAYTTPRTWALSVGYTY